MAREECALSAANFVLSLAQIRREEGRPPDAWSEALGRRKKRSVRGEGLQKMGEIDAVTSLENVNTVAKNEVDVHYIQKSFTYCQAYVFFQCLHKSACLIFTWTTMIYRFEYVF